MHEDTYAPPFYLDLYNFKDGAQNDIFSDSYSYIPTPSESQKEVPTPIDHPVPTDTTQRNSTARTAREPTTSDALIMILFAAVGLYAGAF